MGTSVLAHLLGNLHYTLYHYNSSRIFRDTYTSNRYNLKDIAWDSESRGNHPRQVEGYDAERQREIRNDFKLEPTKFFFHKIYLRRIIWSGVVFSGTSPDVWTFRDTHCIHKMRGSIQTEITTSYNLWLWATTLGCKPSLCQNW